jgi:saccharopine dehydrogenase-like NADP-dependent oxidoreductase
VDLREAGSLQAALSDVDVVVNAAGMEDPALAALIAGHGVPLVDIAATTSYVAALERLELPQPALFSVGLAPGLTNLLAAAVHATAPGQVDLVVPLGAGERHGAAAAEELQGFGQGLAALELVGVADALVAGSRPR